MAVNNIGRPRLPFFEVQGLLCPAAGLLALALTSCRLGQPSGASFASVRIENRSPAQIRQATAQVFQEDGYVGYDAGGDEMLFQKEGTRANDIGQNGFVDSYYGAKTIIRVRAQIVDLGAGAYRLQCQAYMVRNAGDSFFQDQHALTNARRMPYQRLLDKVAQRLKET